MSWLISLILIGIIAWLFMNALNEKQWVDAHSHDEDVAQDPGLFGSFSNATGTGSSAGTAAGKVSGAVSGIGSSISGGLGKLSGDTNTEKLQSAADGVKQKTTQTGEMLGEKLAAARNSDMAGQIKHKTADIHSKVKSKLDDSEMFGKVKENVKKGVDKLGEQVDSKIVGRTNKPDA
ncbi:MAG: hypothetical protein V3U65_15705 [Granulosicoccaceae bacterium]